MILIRFEGVQKIVWRRDAIYGRDPKGGSGFCFGKFRFVEMQYRTFGAGCRSASNRVCRLRSF